ncbi:hypothetical protein OIU84_005962 [Salix udensis]|uniref:DEK-C domain-containing protein n=1 Tax=Salix udensis TaxID=889485 RepID=A0AAD6JXL7_9ROSI|nr:hypothetical protein OIU84_005962 [Salix udensis]
MVSDSELIERLKEFLRNADLDKTTTGTVRRMLEEDFAIDLSDKKAFIREQVDLFLQNELDNDQKNDDNDYTPEDQTVNAETDGCDLQAEQDDEDEDEEKSDVKGGYKESENGGRKRGGGLSKLCCPFSSASGIHWGASVGKDRGCQATLELHKREEPARSK